MVDAFGEIVSDAGDVSLDEAFLTVSCAIGRRFDVVDYLVRLDELASEVPSPTLEGIARHLFAGERPFSGNMSAYYDPANSFLDAVIERRTGIPISLSVLMIEVARRLGVHLVGVGLPGHFLVGSSTQYGKVPELFVDPFNGDVVFDLEGCERLYLRTTGQSNFDPRFAAAVHPIAILDRMLNNLKAIYMGSGDESSLRVVMALRSRLPGLGATERDEFLRLMAPFN